MGRGKTWSRQDIDYLRENWGKKTIIDLAKDLNRTACAIEMKKDRLCLGNKIDSMPGDWVSCNYISSIFYGQCYGYAVQRWEKLGLKITKRLINTHYKKCIKLKDFWEFAEQNKNIFNWDKLEHMQLGIEPKWVDELRKERNSKRYDLRKSYKNWTREEENLLISKVKLYRYTYGELAKEFGRTEASIRRKLADLGVKERPIPMDNRRKWTKEELNEVLEMYNKGFLICIIANKIDRTEIAIINKIKKVEGKYEQSKCS